MLFQITLIDPFEDLNQSNITKNHMKNPVYTCQKGEEEEKLSKACFKTFILFKTICKFVLILDDNNSNCLYGVPWSTGSAQCIL